MVGGFSCVCVCVGSGLLGDVVAGCVVWFWFDLWWFGCDGVAGSLVCSLLVGDEFVVAGIF